MAGVRREVCSIIHTSCRHHELRPIARKCKRPDTHEREFSPAFSGVIDIDIRAERD